MTRFSGGSALWLGKLSYDNLVAIQNLSLQQQDQDLTHFELDSNETRQVPSTGKKVSKRNVVAWENWLPLQQQ